MGRGRGNGRKGGGVEKGEVAELERIRLSRLGIKRDGEQGKGILTVGDIGGPAIIWNRRNFQESTRMTKVKIISNNGMGD